MLEEKQPLFQKSADTRLLEALLSQAEPGQTVTYDEMSATIRRDVRKHASSALYSARRSLLNEKKMVFEAVRGVGMMRLDDSRVVASMESDRKRIQKAAGRSERKANAVVFENLSGPDKTKLLAASAQMGAIAMMSKKTTTKKIESKVVGTAQSIPIGEVLGMFLK